MLSEYPNISELADDIFGIELGRVVGIRESCALQIKISETREIEIEARCIEFLQLERNQLHIPSCFLGEAIVREDVGLALLRREVRELDHRYLDHLELGRGSESTVTCDHAVLSVGEDRVGESKLTDGGSDFGDLRLVVGARVASVGNEVADGSHHDVRVEFIRHRRGGE